jgi:hypothetical protein
MSGTIVRIGASTAGALLALGLLAAPPAGASPSGSHGTRQEQRSDTSCFDATGKTQGRSHSDPDGMSNRGADKPGCTGGFDADRDGNNGCGNDADREDDNNGHCGRPEDAKVKPAKADKDGDDATEVEDTEVDAEKVDNDIKTRCHGHGHDRSTTPGTSPTEVEGAATSNDCSCPKGAEDTTVPGDTDVTAEASGVVPAAASLQTQTAAEDSTATTAAAPTTVLGETLTAPSSGDTTTTATSTPGTQVLGETLSRPGTLARTGAGIGSLALLGGLLCGGGRLTVLARRFLRID